MKQRKLPQMIIIEPELMIHKYGLKGIDLLLYAYISSCYKITAKAVNFNRSYVADMLGCSRRQVINVLHKMLECGILVQFGETFIPASDMKKGHSVKKVHKSVKKIHIMNYIMNEEDNKNNKEINKESDDSINHFIHIANVDIWN